MIHHTVVKLCFLLVGCSAFYKAIFFDSVRMNKNQLTYHMLNPIKQVMKMPTTWSTLLDFGSMNAFNTILL